MTAIFYILAIMVCVSTGLWLLRWIFYFLYPLPSIIGIGFAALIYPAYWAQVEPLPLIPRMLAFVRLIRPRIVAIVGYFRVLLKGHFRSVIEAGKEGNTVAYRSRNQEQVGLVWPPAPQMSIEEPIDIIFPEQA